MFNEGYAATGGATEANIDPAVRIKLGELAQIAELHVRDLTGYDGPSPEIIPVTTGAWAQRTLEAYRPLFTDLAVSLGTTAQSFATSDAIRSVAVLSGGPGSCSATTR